MADLQSFDQLLSIADEWCASRIPDYSIKGKMPAAAGLLVKAYVERIYHLLP